MDLDFLVEHFDTLDEWKQLTFRKIRNHTVYEIEKNGGQSYLKAVTDASASGLVFERDFDVYHLSRVRWRWKVSNVYEKGDARTKAGDDYPARIYINFKYDPKEAGFGEYIKYAIAKKRFGEYPPHSSLNYTWANRPHEEDVIPNAFTRRSRMIPVEHGAENAGIWREYDMDILQDYRRAFGKEPPQAASLAVMSDSDGTGESAVAYFDYIEVYSPATSRGTPEQSETKR